MTRMKDRTGKAKKITQKPGSRQLKEDPFRQFRAWFQEAEKKGVPECNAMHLATSGKNGRPSGRMVLLKSFSENGFVFYTNYRSLKGKNIGENPYVALTFYWQPLDRQVRIQGRAEKIPSADSDRYFASRSLESRAGAIVSPQSHPIADRRTLGEAWKEISQQGTRNDLKRPSSWGGYVVKPFLFEFWQKGEHRLHDRIRYRLVRRKWITDRLAP